MAKIIGLAKLQQKLDRLPDIATEMIKAALEQSADEIVSLAKSLVPVDDGTLRESIGWTWGKAPRGSISLGSMAAASLGGDLTITVYAGSSEAFYARWIEFGTKKMSAQPYFFPSYRANKKHAKRRISKAVRDAARKVASS